MTIEQRLAKLERQNRWMRRAGGFVLAVVACVVLMGQGKAPKAKEPPDLVVKSLKVVNKNGVTKVMLDATGMVLLGDLAEEIRKARMMGAKNPEAFARVAGIPATVITYKASTSGRFSTRNGVTMFLADD